MENNNEVPKTTADLNDPDMNMPDQMQTAQPPRSKVAPMLGVLLIMLVLVLGGLYLWGSMLAEDEKMDETDQMQTEPMTEETEAAPVGQSDEVDDLETYVDDTEFDAMDKEFADMEAEMDAAFGTQ